MSKLLAIAISTMGIQLSAPALASPSASSCEAWTSIHPEYHPTHFNDDPADPLLEDLWKAWANGRSKLPIRVEGAAASIHLSTVSGAPTGPEEKEVIAARSTTGWRAYARRRVFSKPWGRWRLVRLSGVPSAEIDATLDDPCLWVAPRFLNNEIRLKNGRYDERPDGPSTMYDISSGSRHWGGWQLSWNVGPQAHLKSLLLSRAFGFPEVRPDTIGPNGWFDRP